MDDVRSTAFQQVFGEELAIQLSPARQVTEAWPPTVMFFGTADRLLPGGVLLYNKAKDAGVVAELYLAEGEGHGFVNIAPWNLISSRYAADFFMRAGVLYEMALPMAPPGELRKYDGEPIETILIKTNVNPTRQRLEDRGRQSNTEEPSPPN